MSTELILAIIYLLTRITKFLTLYKLSRTEKTAKSMIKAVNVNSHVNRLVEHHPVKRNMALQTARDKVGKNLNKLIKSVETPPTPLSKYLTTIHNIQEILL